MVGETPQFLDCKRNQIKTTPRFHLSPDRMTTIKKTKMFSKIARVNRTWYQYYGNNVEIPQKLNIKSSNMAQQLSCVWWPECHPWDPPKGVKKNPCSTKVFLLPLNLCHALHSLPSQIIHTHTHTTLTFFEPRMWLQHIYSWVYAEDSELAYSRNICTFMSIAPL